MANATASTGVATSIHAPCTKSSTDAHAIASMTRTAMPAAGHTASAVPATPTASAHPASTSRLRPVPIGLMNRCDSRSSMTFACTCMPGIFPSAKGTV